MPTQRLYYADAYLLEFEGEVLETIAGGTTDFGLILDRTCFYPTGGGQLFDTGRLAGIPVVDVEERDGHIVHWLESEPGAKVGERVLGRVDAVRRRHHRQQHTGQHVLSRLLEDRLGYATESARLGENGNSIDLAIDDLGWDRLEAVERAANDIVWGALPVSVELLDVGGRGEAYAHKADAEGVVRLIDVEGIDRCPCGGTHVQNTAEIGIIACTRIESIARGTRIHFLCGERAFLYLRRRDRQLAELALHFTSGADQLLEKFERLEQEAKELKRELSELRAAQSRARAESWIAQAETLELDGRAARGILRRASAEELGPVAVRLASEEELLSILIAPEAPRAQILLARGAALSVDCAEELRRLLEPVQGRGGGRADQARGSFPSDRVDEVLDRIASRFGLSASEPPQQRG